MLRDQLGQAYKDAAEQSDERAVATLRLVLTALKERDHCAREAGAEEGLSDEDIRALLDDMISQREDEISRCEAKARLEMAAQEAEEIAVLQRFLPHQMSTDEVDAAVDQVIRDVGATKLKDIGRVIATLKERYDGQMDFALAKRHSCSRLG